MDERTTYFGWPYGLGQTLTWLWNHMSGPSSRLSQGLPSSIRLNEVATRIRLGFIGDIMPVSGRRLEIGQDVIDFFSEADYVTGNFEGVIRGNTWRRPFLSQLHSEAILEGLQVLKSPGRFILGCINNHSADFGRSAYLDSCAILRKKGFLVMDAIDTPRLLLPEGINLAGCTVWSNQKCSYLPNFAASGSLFDERTKFNILFPHWGVEMEALPRRRQIEKAGSLLESWDAVIGHHSHYPQPVTSVGPAPFKKIAAFSLGNFCTWVRLGKYHEGIILKIGAGPGANGALAVGEVSWRRIRIRLNSGVQHISLLPDTTTT